MGRRALDSVVQLLTISSLLASPFDVKAVEDCTNDSPQNTNVICRARLTPKTAQEILSTIDKNFKELPSCQGVNSRLDGFITSVQKMAKAGKSTDTNEPSILEQINLARESHQ